MYVKRVRSRDMALNPVARAIAWTRLQASSLKMKVMLYEMETGFHALDEIQALARYFSIVLIAAQHSKLQDGDNKHLPLVVDEALRALVVMSNAGHKYDSSKAAVLEDGIDASALITKIIRTDSVNHAMREMIAMDERTRREAQLSGRG